MDFFVAGVVVAFAGQIGDNLWWGIAWSQQYTSGATESLGNWWSRHGTFSNIFCRQIATVVAAILHLMAADIGARAWARLAVMNLLFTAAFMAMLH